MSDDTVYALKLVVFTILIVLGVVGFVVRLREVRASKSKDLEKKS